METTEPRDAGGFRRQLVAIVCADVVGYTRLMAADENATYTAYKSYMSQIVGCAEQRDVVREESAG